MNEGGIKKSNLKPVFPDFIGTGVNWPFVPQGW